MEHLPDTPILHRLPTDLLPPEQMNDPFDYEPHPLCQMAARQVMDYLDDHERLPGWPETDDRAAFCNEARQGKMFGVLVVTRDELPDGSPTPPCFLAAFSGQLCGSSNYPGFVPPVFDYLQPDGYFKTEERAISRINQEIARRTHDPVFLQLQRDIAQLHTRQADALARQRAANAEAKQRRDNRRRQGEPLSQDELQTMTTESQYQKAELRRIKKRFQQLIADKQEAADRHRHAIDRLEQERKQRSQQLQRWLFAQFRMRNVHGQTRNLLELFSHTSFHEPPAGAGECCEPKLLQYAFAHGLRPRAMAMFWYGDQPHTEIRHHGHYYPACSGKCRPILQWMLDAPESLSSTLGTQPDALTVVYEDDALVVVAKPAGLLSVPGVQTQHSVYSLMASRYPHSDSPLMVHRLDMATSGLLVMAKSRHAHKLLARQFAEHTVTKRYVALLDGTPAPGTPLQGTIALPLRADWLDRPRQVVDHAHGKPAITHYNINKVENGRTHITLQPLTGRTHQLRMHCAHPDGLALPIVGDTLYGRPAERLYLHAAFLSFVHPETGQPLFFHLPAPF